MSSAEALFLTRARNQLDELNLDVDALRGAVGQERSISQRSVAPLPRRAVPQLTGAEIERAHEQGFKCLLPFRLMGTPGVNAQRLQVRVGDTKAWVGVGQHPFLLRLLRAHCEDDGGWVRLNDLDAEDRLADGPQQAIGRLRDPFKNVPLGGDQHDCSESHVRLIEQERSRLRRSVPRSLHHVDSEALYVVLEADGRAELTALLDAMSK